MIRYFRWPVTFDATRLKEELNLLTAEWQHHYNKSHYEGDWSLLPLRSIGGSVTSGFAVGNTVTGHTYKDTVLLEQCPYMQSVIDFFPCEKTSIRLMKLSAGAVIREHSDHALCVEEGELRIHVPVQTHEDVYFYLEDTRIPMQEGECWYLNLTLPHSVKNQSAVDRVHLVIDCLVNDEITRLLEEPTFRETMQFGQQRTNARDEETTRRMIEELLLQDTPAARQMAEELGKRDKV
jgi:hypothetical protein